MATPFEVVIEGRRPYEVEEVVADRRREGRLPRGLSLRVEGARFRAGFGLNSPPYYGLMSTTPSGGLLMRGHIYWFGQLFGLVLLPLVVVAMVTAGVALIVQGVGGRSVGWFAGPACVLVGAYGLRMLVLVMMRLPAGVPRFQDTFRAALQEALRPR